MSTDKDQLTSIRWVVRVNPYWKTAHSPKDLLQLFARVSHWQMNTTTNDNKITEKTAEA